MPDTKFSSSRKLVLLAGVLDRKGYIVGDANANSGLHLLDVTEDAEQPDSPEWRHKGWNNVRCFGLDVVSDVDGSALFIAGGNGVLRSDDLAEWRVTTDWRTTEVLDVAAIVGEVGISVAAATAYGPALSTDGGLSWRSAVVNLAGRGTDSTFCSSVVWSADRVRLFLGTEDGVFIATEPIAGGPWSDAGPRGVAVRSIVEDPIREGRWLAATDGDGLLVSEDSFGSWRELLPKAALYCACWSPNVAGLFAVGGFAPAIWISPDAGQTIEEYSAPREDMGFHALAFDPDRDGLLWVGTTDAGVYQLDLETRAWRFIGLADASIRKLLFVKGGLGVEQGH